MNGNLKEAIKNRRSYYSITGRSPVPDKQIEDILELALMYVPSAFNSQSTRAVLLLGDHHKKLWEITKSILKEKLSPETFTATETKIDKQFASGYGTVLFFEDLDTIEELQRKHPSYKDSFPKWAHQTSAMHQFAVWTLLEDAGFGASLQHYNPLIDEEVRKTWNLPEHWELIAEMPFGLPAARPGEKENRPLEEKMRIFR